MVNEFNVLMFVIAAFLLYHMSRCNCNEGFSLGGQVNNCIIGSLCGPKGQPGCKGDNTDGRFPPNILTDCNALQWNDTTRTCQMPGSGTDKYITKNGIDYNCKWP